MIKRWIIAASIIVLLLLIVAFLAIRFLIVDEAYKSPGRFGSYPNSGMYTFNPETVFESLEQGKSDVFMPYFGSPDEIKLYYDPITWSQSDYLKIADALSKKIWKESSGSQNWKVESIYFSQDCKDNAQGFNSFHIVYYRDLGVANLKRRYATRLIDLESWRGLAYWGADAIFSVTLLSRWKTIDLKDFPVSAENALQIAEEQGGNKTDKNHCSTINVSMYQVDNEKWDVNYFPANFEMYVDANSGKYELLNK
jgi:hypothetical protein